MKQSFWHALVIMPLFVSRELSGATRFEYWLAVTGGASHRDASTEGASFVGRLPYVTMLCL